MNIYIYIYIYIQNSRALIWNNAASIKAPSSKRYARVANNFITAIRPASIIQRRL